MVKKSSLAKKLASYSAVAVAVLVADKNASAQIVYTNLNPGDTIGRYNSHDVKLDLNNDGVYDFDFNYNSFSGVTYYVRRFEHGFEINCGNAQPYYSNAIYGSTYRIFLNYGDTISSKLKPWYGRNLAGIECFTNQCYPDIDTSFNTYIGLKISKKGNTYYGWARLEVGYSSNENLFVVIKDYAYNNTPDSAIYAGVECTPNFTQPSLQINSNTANTNAVNTIQWCVNNKPIPGDTTQSITLSKYGLYQVREGDTTQCYTESRTYNYVNCNAYHPYISPPPAIICEGDSYPILNTDTIPTDFSIRWYDDDTVLQGDSSRYLYVIPYIQNNIYAVVYETNGCFDTTNIVKFTFDTLLEGGVFIEQHWDTLFALPYNNSFPQGVTYRWYNSDSIIDDKSYYYIIPADGFYVVAVFDSNVCSVNADGYYSLTGINRIHPSDILIGQDNSLLNIKFNGTPFIGYKMVIYNYLGQQVYTTEITSGNMMIDLNALAKGLYLVTLEKGDSRVVKKIVLQ